MLYFEFKFSLRFETLWVIWQKTTIVYSPKQTDMKPNEMMYKWAFLNESYLEGETKGWLS